MIKNFLITSLCVLLSGCMSSPEYYNNEQTIFLRRPENSTLVLEGYESNIKEIKVKSSPFSLKGIISKEGFEDKTIEIKSHFTDDQWATISHMNGDDKKTSALSLLIPMNTFGYTSAGFIAGSYGLMGGPVGIITIPVGTVLGFIYGLGKDVYNIIIGIPSVIILNPWYEYGNGDFSSEILTPTQEFKIMCYNKKDTFIGNNECLSCDTEERVISLPEECNRCPGRYMDGHYCIKSCRQGTFKNDLNDCVSCDLDDSVKSSILSCNQCNNREMKNGFCIKKCNGFHTKDGACVSCEDNRGYQPYYDEISYNNECYHCPNREMVGSECRLKNK